MTGVAESEGWLRLDKRMLLVHPITELVKFIPVLIGTVLLGTSSGNHLWSLVPLTLIVLFALTRWFTTSYRVGPTHVELRTGLFQRKKLSVPRSRIRSVDIEADPLRRVLGLAVVVIGTGRATEREDTCKLDALDARVVPGLRAQLLAHTSQSAVAGHNSAESTRTAREIGHWRAAWARYAPLSLTGFAVVAPVVGFGFQYGLGELLFESEAAQHLGEGGVAVLLLAALALLVAIVLVVSLAAWTRYLITYHGLQILDNGHTLHVRHGLFTTRQITMDLARFRGATVREPLLLRLAGAAELEAVMVGEKPKLKLLPQAPRAAVERTLAELLEPRRRSTDTVAVQHDSFAIGHSGRIDAASTPPNRPGSPSTAPAEVVVQQEHSYPQPASGDPTAPSAAARPARPETTTSPATAEQQARPDNTAPATTAARQAGLGTTISPATAGRQVGPDTTDPATTTTQQAGPDNSAPTAAAARRAGPDTTASAPAAARQAGQDATARSADGTLTAVDPGQRASPLGAGIPRTTAQTSAPLTPHGPVARRRRYTRALIPAVLLVLAWLVLGLIDAPLSPWWLAVPALMALAALPLAEDRYRGLGHTVIPATTTAPAWLITRSGSLDRTRDCLEAPGIIGWTVRQSFWQRRAGVATVVAATAAGRKRYSIIDLPLDQAHPLIESMTPGQLGARHTVDG
ncbi:PH domain-containing protein [Nocardia sp. NPDC127579]|uniref:PH domain-containing protein n=1 Tax=Nocardia sp. NPDC127579 TaxID=3345402 RepID=UPI00363365DB